MSEIPEVFAIFEQKLAHVLSFNLRQKGQKKAIEELLVYFSGIVGRASKAEARIAELERDKKALSGIEENLREHIDIGTLQLSAATARIAELERDKKALSGIKEILREHIEVGTVQLSTATARIAELEALVDELKPYRDGYDPEKVFPPEGEWVWLRDCDDNIEPVQYDQETEWYWNYEGYWMPDDGDIRRWYPIGKLPEVQE